MIDGSIQKGIVTHMEYVVTIKTKSDEQRWTAQLLMDLMGDSQSMPMNNRRAPSPEVRYTSRNGHKEEKVELEPLNRI